MPEVIYVTPSGEDRAVDAVIGESLMVTATRAGVPGIIGECGGNASCGTCHVWVREEFWEAVGPTNEAEEDLLDLGATDRRETSRLSCQVVMTPDLEGLVVEVPPDQP